MPNSQNRRSAFTLIELLVALAVLGILAVLLLNVSGGVRVKAASQSSVSNLRQLASAYLLASAERNNELIWGLDYDTSRGSSLDRMWCTALLPYLNAQTVDFSSPEAYFQSLPKVFLAPADVENPETPWRRSYAPNYSAYSPPGYNRTTEPRLRFTRILQRSKLILIPEWKTGAASQSSASQAVTQLADFYKNGSVNVLFADGHVETVSRRDLLPGGSRENEWLPQLQ